MDIVKRHEDWRSQCINLIPSENIMSPLARKAIASDLGHRYTNPEGFYRGTKFSDELIEEVEKLACRLFGAKVAFVNVLSGHMAVLSALFALSETRDVIMMPSPEDGGYPLNVAPLARKLVYFPFDKENMNIDVDAAVERISETKPKLIFLGASLFLFPHPVREICKVANEVEATVVYDGSHVLGLIAGGEFQKPFTEGASVLLGSTHKSLPGPQGGIVLLKDDELAERFKEVLGFPPVLVDNIHLHRLAALGITLEEMLVYGKEYAKQIVKNAKALAETLYKGGIDVACPHLGFTRSHQILIRAGGREREIANLLERANIIVDEEIRLGTQEVTRRGMKEREMKILGEVISELINGERKPEDVRDYVIELSKEFQDVHYCFKGDFP